MNCIKCGAQIDDSSFYCVNCRKSLDAESSKAAADTARRNVKRLVDEAKDEMQISGPNVDMADKDSLPSLNEQLSKIMGKLYLHVAACIGSFILFVLLCLVLQFRGGLIYTVIIIFLEGYFIYRIKQSIRYSSLIKKSIREMKNNMEATDKDAAVV